MPRTRWISRISERQVVASGWVLLLLVTGVGCSPTGEEGRLDRRQNIVLVTLDTTRADRLGAYGSNRGLTPNLDELAAQSAVFELAIAQSGVTPVSHASIFTGLNPYGHGLRVLHGSRYLLADDAVTVAELLSDAGYATAGVISAFPAGSRFGLAQGFGVFDEEFLEPPGPDTVQAGGTIDTGRSQRRADATTDRALAWLRQAREPYFLWVHYFDPHDTEVLPPEDFAPPQPIEGVGSSDPFEALRAVYDREVAYMDAQVGRLLAALDKNGTTILVTADHGEGLGEHGWWGHGILYQEQIHIPLLVRGPSVVARSIETMVRQVDLAPTVLDLTGFEGERPPMDGRSLLPLLEGGPTPAESSAPWAYADLMNKRVFPGVGDDGNVNDDFLLVVVDPPWKYIHHLEKPRESELYHLGDDPDEANNLLATRLDLGTSYSRQLQSLDPLPKGPTPESQMTEEELDRLRALGYVED